jgi:hypothetical protein
MIEASPMWTARRTVVHAAAVVALFAPALALTDGAQADQGGPPADSFLGADGLYYRHAPAVVEGADGTLYYGEEFDSACAYGRRYSGALKRLQRLARVIERSGRRVVYTVAPNKSSVNREDLPMSSLPHGECDLVGMKAQDSALDRFRDPDFIQTRAVLERGERDGKELYWKLDTHWTTVGAGYYVKELARRLDPRLQRRQTYRAGHETILVDLSYLGILSPTYETGPARFSTTPVRVAPIRGNDPWDPTRAVDIDVGWNTRPAHRTWPGRTAILGDSFTYRALGAVMPLFRRGRFMWIGNVPEDELVSQIKRSDTVVLEVVQRYLPISVLADTGFRKALARKLHRR